MSSAAPSGHYVRPYADSYAYTYSWFVHAVVLAGPRVSRTSYVYAYAYEYVYGRN
jgi:hypothetical protein